MKWLRESEEGGDIYGPGTDLVVSVLAVMAVFLTVTVVKGELVRGELKNKSALAELMEDFLKQLDIPLDDFASIKKRIQHPDKVAEEITRLENELKEAATYQKLFDDLGITTEELTRLEDPGVFERTHIANLEGFLSNLNEAERELIRVGDFAIVSKADQERAEDNEELLSQLNEAQEKLIRSGAFVVLSSADHETIEDLQEELEGAKKEIAVTKAQLEKLKKPSFVQISDEEASENSEDNNEPVFRFGLGVADVTPEFIDVLEDKVSAEVIVNEVLIESGHFNTVEIIGHTDGSGVNVVEEGGARRDKDSALDDNLLDAILEAARSERHLANIPFGSNADLGLLRAAQVAILLKTSGPETIRNFKFRALSAGQILMPKSGPGKKNANPERRRVEIRFVKTGDEVIDLFKSAEKLSVVPD